MGHKRNHELASMQPHSTTVHQDFKVDTGSLCCKEIPPKADMAYSEGENVKHTMQGGRRSRGKRETKHGRIAYSRTLQRCTGLQDEHINMQSYIKQHHQELNWDTTREEKRCTYNASSWN